MKIIKDIHFLCYICFSNYPKIYSNINFGTLYAINLNINLNNYIK